MKGHLRCPVTLSLILVSVLVFLIQGPALAPQAFQTLGQLSVGVIRHGNWAHLALNCVLLLLGGWMAEPKIGSARAALLISVCAMMGVLGEVTFSGPGFIGLSGAAYGLIAFAVIATSVPERREINAWMIAVALSAEFAFLRADVAVFSHITAAITGGGIAMLSSFFGKQKGPHLKQMEWKHVSRVVEIIAQTDEDDAAEAESTFLDTGYENMFVLMDRGEVLGVTGFGLDDQVPNLAWLSWTYLDEASMGQGLGADMFNDLLGSLAKQGVRKIFIETSDYSEDGELIYASAHRLYQEFGANKELTVPDYHAPGEAKIIFGIDNPDAQSADPLDTEDKTGIRITGLEKAPETKDVAGFLWEECPVGLAGLDHYIAQLRESGFRMGVLPIPGDLSEANAEGLRGQGLTHLGRLKDYYGPDQSQDWWVFQPK